MEKKTIKKKNKGGRPKKPVNTAATKRVTVYMTEQEFNDFEKWCVKNRKKSQAAAARDILFERIYNNS